jgi:hypothetical protein
MKVDMSRVLQYILRYTPHPPPRKDTVKKHATAEQRLADQKRRAAALGVEIDSIRGRREDRVMEGDE